MLYFTDKVLNKLRKKAEKEYPAECCGILLGYADSRGKTAVLVYPTANAAALDSRLHFSIDPTEILRAEMYAEQNHLEIVGL